VCGVYLRVCVYMCVWFVCLGACLCGVCGLCVWCVCRVCVVCDLCVVCLCVVCFVCFVFGVCVCVCVCGVCVCGMLCICDVWVLMVCLCVCVCVCVVCLCVIVRRISPKNPHYFTKHILNTIGISDLTIQILHLILLCAATPKPWTSGRGNSLWME